MNTFKTEENTSDETETNESEGKFTFLKKTLNLKKVFGTDTEANAAEDTPEISNRVSKKVNFRRNESSSDFDSGGGEGSAGNFPFKYSINLKKMLGPKREDSCESEEGEENSRKLSLKKALQFKRPAKIPEDSENPSKEPFSLKKVLDMRKSTKSEVTANETEEKKSYSLQKTLKLSRITNFTDKIMKRGRAFEADNTVGIRSIENTLKNEKTSSRVRSDDDDDSSSEEFEADWSKCRPIEEECELESLKENMTEEYENVKDPFTKDIFVHNNEVGSRYRWWWWLLASPTRANSNSTISKVTYVTLVTFDPKNFIHYSSNLCY